MASSNYNNFAMDRLSSGPSGDGVPPAIPQNDIESITIRRADNGYIVEVSRATPESKPGEASAPPSKPEKPRLAKSVQELTSMVDSLLGVGGEQQEQPPEEEQPPVEENVDASQPREGVDEEA
jgi:hypothetical protein